MSNAKQLEEAETVLRATDSRMRSLTSVERKLITDELDRLREKVGRFDAECESESKACTRLFVANTALKGDLAALEGEAERTVYVNGAQLCDMTQATDAIERVLKGGYFSQAEVADFGHGVWAVRLSARKVR